MKRKAKVEPIPENLNSAAFLTLWAAFQKYRTELKKTMTPTSIRLTLNKLSAAGVESACAALTESMEQGWQGVFPRATAPATSLPESCAELWERWRNARRTVGHSDPARAPGDLKALQAIACECKTGAEFWHVFKAYCEDTDRFLESRGWALEWLPSRMSKYTGALLKCRSMKNREDITNAESADDAESTTALDKLLDENNIPY